MLSLSSLFVFTLTAVSCNWNTAPPGPVVATHGMVVSSNPLASEAGVAILKKGGNAIDAAITVSFVLAVVHPIAGNIGGGGFLLYHDAGTGKEFSLDYRETAPSASREEMYLDPLGDVVPDLSRIGYLAAGVPGTVAGLYHAWNEFGNLPWRELLYPAIALAKDGFIVDEPLSQSLQDFSSLLNRFEETRRIFLRNGCALPPGKLFRQSDLARSLEVIAREGAKGFYQGEIAEMIDEDMRAHGGIMTREDLANYSPRKRTPVRGRYEGHEIISMGLPSSGGIILIEMLNMLEILDRNWVRLEPFQRIHLVVECMRRAFADRATFLGDADFSDIPIERLLSREHAQERLNNLDDTASTESRQVGSAPMPVESLHTTHLSVIDPGGNAVAITTTINGNFGSGVVVKGTGFLLNNEMDDFTVHPGVPNMFGLFQGQANVIAPGKRPLSAMTPTFVKKDGRILLILGSPGGPTIINTVLQIILNVVDRGMDLYEAVDEPRIHHQWMPDVIVAETGSLSSYLSEQLEALGHDVVYRDRIGEASCIRVDPVTGYREGVADPRRWGMAQGF